MLEWILSQLYYRDLSIWFEETFAQVASIAAKGPRSQPVTTVLDTLKDEFCPWSHTQNISTETLLSGPSGV